MASKNPTNSKHSIWKIRRKTDGQFSNCKGLWPIFTKHGGVFERHCYLLTHLTRIKNHCKKNQREFPYKNCEIIEFACTEEARVDVTGYGE
jgi:hypothetical protein